MEPEAGTRTASRTLRSDAAFRRTSRPCNSRRDVAITPDGTRIVYTVTLNGQRQLVVRALDQLEATPLAGLGNAPRGPFVSPDGNWVGYFDGNRLRKVSIFGGPPVTICDTLGGPRGTSWDPDDTIIFGAGALTSGLWHVSAGGGEPQELTAPDPGQSHQWPEILPGNEAVLFTIVSGAVENAQIAVLSIANGEVEVLIPGGSNPRYVPTGHIVYGVGGTLRAVGFDLERLEVTSDPIPVLEGVITKASGAAEFGVSRDGSLVYVAGSPQVGLDRTSVWVDREGREEALAAEPRAYTYPRISPDGSQVALDVRDEEIDIWIWDFARETLRRLTFDPSNDWYQSGHRTVGAWPSHLAVRVEEICSGKRPTAPAPGRAAHRERELPGAVCLFPEREPVGVLGRAVPKEEAISAYARWKATGRRSLSWPPSSRSGTQKFRPTADGWPMSPMPQGNTKSTYARSPTWTRVWGRSQGMGVAGRSGLGTAASCSISIPVGG